MAYKDYPAHTNINEIHNDEIEKDLILIGIAGIKDHLR